MCLKSYFLLLSNGGGEGPGPPGETKGGRPLLRGWPAGAGTGQRGRNDNPHPWTIVLLTQITLKPDSAMTKSQMTPAG